MDQHAAELKDLKELAHQEKNQKQDWATKYKLNEQTLSAKQSELFTHLNKAKVLENEVARLSLIVEDQSRGLQDLSTARDSLEKELRETLIEKHGQEAEYKDLLDVARKLEAQRHKQYHAADDKLQALDLHHFSMQAQSQMEIEDLTATILREAERLRVV